MKNFLFAFFLIFSNFTLDGLTVTSGITTIVGRGAIANRQLEGSTAGNAVAIWTESSLSSQVQAAYFDGTRWFAPLTLAPGAFPQVGVPTSGSAVAVWLNTLNASSTQIFASRFNPLNNTWSTPRQISTPGINSAPQIAVNSQGNALVVWIQNFPSTIQAATFNASTSSWSGPFTLIIGSASSPQVSLDDSNRGIVMWFGPTFGIEAVTVAVP
ncbi:MAG: hypothetical protein JJU12_06245 [Chlamydiales bacterium]|nr:hypothetical protein [Chlamydiales bacterium]